MTLGELESMLARIYPGTSWPKPLHLLRALSEVKAGKPSNEAARAAGTTPANLDRLVQAPDPMIHLLGEPQADHSQKAEKVRATVGQLLIGNLAERVFEDTYRKAVGSTELQLEDDRTSV